MGAQEHGLADTMTAGRFADMLERIKELLWEWDPIGIGIEDRGSAPSEYDGLSVEIYGLLQRGASTERMERAVRDRITSDFGLEPVEEDLRRFITAVTSLTDSNGDSNRSG